jgi:hypothetical protein
VAAIISYQYASELVRFPGEPGAGRHVVGGIHGKGLLFPGFRTFYSGNGHHVPIATMGAISACWPNGPLKGAPQ